MKWVLSPSRSDEKIFAKLSCRSNLKQKQNIVISLHRESIKSCFKLSQNVLSIFSFNVHLNWEKTPAIRSGKKTFLLLIKWITRKCENNFSSLALELLLNQWWKFYKAKSFTKIFPLRKCDSVEVFEFQFIKKLPIAIFCESIIKYIFFMLFQMIHSPIIFLHREKCLI